MSAGPPHCEDRPAEALRAVLAPMLVLRVLALVNAGWTLVIFPRRNEGIATPAARKNAPGQAVEDGSLLDTTSPHMGGSVRFLRALPMARKGSHESKYSFATPR